MSENILQKPDRRFSKSKLRSGILVGIFGIFILVAGIVIIVYQPLISKAKKQIREEVVLLPDKIGLQIWAAPKILLFRLYVFHVTNPEAVMQGAVPIFQERGPYVYDEHTHKNILRHDDEMDEVEYTITRIYRFNQKESGNCTENDEVMILNPAYIGTMNTLAGLPPNFMAKYGNDIPKLFPNPNTIFVKGKVKDVFFSGLTLQCDSNKYKELALICNTLKKKRPPLMWTTDTEGVYLYSFFHRMNATPLGPYTVNRGFQDISRLGDITSDKGKRILKVYRNKTCNTVKGTDAITWAPMDEKPPRVFTYVESFCRTMYAEYRDEIVINGLLGWRFTLTDKLWEPDEIECYCPVVKKEAQCLPKGLLDITKCQEGPVIASEPHFLHGDPALLNYATGLKPDEEKHWTFIVIDPLTGAPLIGREKMQLNMKLTKLQVTLLENVSEGYFPMIWCDDGGIPEQVLLKSIYQTHRLINVLSFLQCVPMIVGIFLIFVGIILYGNPRRPKKRIVIPTMDSVLVPSNRNLRNIIHRSQQRPRRVFE